MSFKFRTRILILLIIPIITIFASCNREVEEHDIDVEIQNYMDKYDLPSISACVIKNNTIVWQKSYGYADVNNQVPATKETIYPIASVSKLIVATAAMQLVEQGILELNKDINDYIPINIRNPHFPDIPITPKMLFTHTSGLAWPQSQDHSKLWDSFGPDSAPGLTEWVPQFLIPGGEYYQANIWKNTEPGKFELYSNTGTCLLAYIVEQLSGKDFRSYCKENIFDPLEMFNTSYYYSPLDPEKLATLYLNNNAIVLPYDDRLFASGLLKTSIEDLSHFLMAYINKGEYNGHQILNKSSVDDLMTIQSLRSGICLLWRARMRDILKV